MEVIEGANEGFWAELGRFLGRLVTDCLHA